MTKRKAPPADDILAEQYLSPADHVATLLADKDAAVAALEVERDAAKLQAFRMQMTLQIQQAEAALKEARERANALALHRKGLAEDLAVRYALSWETTALDDVSGRLVPLPPDKE